VSATSRPLFSIIASCRGLACCPGSLRRIIDPFPNSGIAGSISATRAAAQITRVAQAVAVGRTATFGLLRPDARAACVARHPSECAARRSGSPVMFIDGKDDAAGASVAGASCPLRRTRNCRQNPQQTGVKSASGKARGKARENTPQRPVDTCLRDQITVTARIIKASADALRLRRSWRTINGRRVRRLVLGVANAREAGRSVLGHSAGPAISIHSLCASPTPHMMDLSSST